MVERSEPEDSAVFLYSRRCGHFRGTGFGTVKKWLLAAGAFLVAVGFAILGRPAKKAREAQRRADDLIRNGSDKARREAKAQGEKANQLQHEAREAAEKGREAMDRAGQNADMADLISEWNSDRVQ